MLIIQNSPSSHQSPDAPIGRYIEAHRAAEGIYPCRGTLSMAHEKRRIEDADRWKRRLDGSHLATNPTALRLRARPRSRRARRAAHWASGAEASCACERRCGKTYTDGFHSRACCRTSTSQSESPIRQALFSEREAAVTQGRSSISRQSATRLFASRTRLGCLKLSLGRKTHSGVVALNATICVPMVCAYGEAVIVVEGRVLDTRCTVAVRETRLP